MINILHTVGSGPMCIPGKSLSNNVRMNVVFPVEYCPKSSTYMLLLDKGVYHVRRLLFPISPRIGPLHTIGLASISLSFNKAECASPKLSNFSMFLCLVERVNTCNRLPMVVSSACKCSSIHQSHSRISSVTPPASACSQLCPSTPLYTISNNIVQSKYIPRVITSHLV